MKKLQNWQIILIILFFIGVILFLVYELGLIINNTVLLGSFIFLFGVGGVLIFYYFLMKKKQEEDDILKMMKKVIQRWYEETGERLIMDDFARGYIKHYEALNKTFYGYRFHVESTFRSSPDLIVICDKDNGNIVAFNCEVSPLERENPFLNFDPYEGKFKPRVKYVEPYKEIKEEETSISGEPEE